MVLYISQDKSIVKTSYFAVWGFVLLRFPCVSLHQALYKYIYLYTYIHSSQSEDIQLLLLQGCYFRSHYLARHDAPNSTSDWLHPAP